MKKGVLKNFAIYTGKDLCWSLFLIKLQAFRPAILLKWDPKAVVFMWILRNFEEHLFSKTCANKHSSRSSTKLEVIFRNKYFLWICLFYICWVGNTREVSKEISGIKWVNEGVSVEVAIRRCSSKKVFLHVSQIWQENICVGASF